MATPIIPRIVRGRLYFETGPVLFPTFAQAACAWSAAECHRLDIAERSADLLADIALVNSVLDEIIAARLAALESEGVANG